MASIVVEEPSRKKKKKRILEVKSSAVKYSFLIPKLPLSPTSFLDCPSQRQVFQHHQNQSFDT